MATDSLIDHYVEVHRKAEKADEREGAIIAAKIAFILENFPRLTHSMLQIGLGSQIPAKSWRPILDEMVSEGHVRINTELKISPLGRSQTYTFISLT